MCGKLYLLIRKFVRSFALYLLLGIVKYFTILLLIYYTITNLLYDYEIGDIFYILRMDDFGRTGQQLVIGLPCPLRGGLSCKSTEASLGNYVISPWLDTQQDFL